MTQKTPTKATKENLADKPTTAAHIELERKVKVSVIEYRALPLELKKMGFVLATTSVISDTLLPSKKGDTHRIRREQLLGGASPQVLFFETTKAHPRTPDGVHIRSELEHPRKASEAESILTAAVQKTRAPLPSYSKIRHTYVGKYKGMQVTVALDVAQGLGRYSGHYMEIEVILPLRSRSVTRTLERIIKLAHRLLGEHRKPVMSYRKMLLASIRVRT